VIAAADTTTAPGRFLAPYVPSPEAVVNRMLDVARVGPGDTVYDLGSGDGRVVIAAAQRFGSRAVGFELDDRRFATSSARVRDLGLTPRARIVHGDLASVDLKPATVVALYQLPAVNEMLRPALEQQLRPGARVVTHDFPISGWSASQVVTERSADGTPHAIYLYTIGSSEKESAIMADKRSYTLTGTSLELGGVASGRLRSFEGGEAVGNVVSGEAGPNMVVPKRITGASYTDLSMSFGAGMSSDLYDWITATLQRQDAPKDGSVLMIDFNGVGRLRQDFFHGLISEIGFPACDASSKDPAYLTLKITPEYTRMASSTGKASSFGIAKVARLLPSNFRLSIDGLDCTGVSKIDAILVTQESSPSQIGEQRDSEKQPGVLEISNLAITVADDDQNGFSDWFDQFVIKGDSSARKNGTLEYLDPGLKSPIFTLTFNGLGIFRLARPRMDAGSNTIAVLRAEMYCEQILFEYGSSASAQKVPASGNGAKTALRTPQGIAARPGAANPAYVQPEVQKIADWKLSSAAAQTPVAPPLGRPLKFRS